MNTYKMQPININGVGEIPTTWKLKRLKDTGTFKSGRDYKHLLDGDIPLFGSSETPFAFVNQAICNKKAVAVGRKGTIDKPFITPNIFWAVDTCLYNTVSNKSWKLEYVYYWMKIIPFKYLGSQTAIPSLTQTQVNNVFIPQPPLNKQIVIANYLDCHTAKIDSEVALLEQKSILLDEYKNALIYETVTRGLDKKAEMKDTCIKFIGVIPNHWKVKRIKDIFNISRGRVIGASTLEKEPTNILKYPVFSAATENDGVIGYLETYDFDNNLLTWTTDGAKAGAVFIRSGQFNCTNVCGILQPKGKSNNLKFQKYALSVQTPNYQRPDINGAKIMSNEMAKILIALPDFNEQTLIAEFLDDVTQKIEKQIDLINKKVELLKEYKQSLIYEAVTGQLDIE